MNDCLVKPVQPHVLRGMLVNNYILLKRIRVPLLKR